MYAQFALSSAVQSRQFLRDALLLLAALALTNAAYTKDSADLPRTLIVPTLESRVEAGKNAVWCASLPALWKHVEEHDSGGPIELQSHPAAAELLNKTGDPRADIPSGALYLASGLVKDGIADRIRRELPQRFPGKTPPDFPENDPDALIAYAYMKIGITFTTAYGNSTLQWVSRYDNEKPIRVMAFSRLPTDPSTSSHGKADSTNDAKPEILYWRYDQNKDVSDCIIDLDPNPEHDQLLIAYMDYMPSLSDMLARMNDKIHKSKISRKDRELGLYDSLLVPCIKRDISCHLSEIENRPILNGRMKGRYFSSASQNISFALNRSGAFVESETYFLAPFGVEMPPERHFNFTRPFLIVMKTRDAPAPYFVMWVENAELMTPCSKDGAAVGPQGK